MFRTLVSIFVFIMSVSCASVHSGKYAEEGLVKTTSGTKAVGKKGLLVSGEENRQLASKYFTAFDFTFENTTAKWIRIKNVSLDFGSASTNEQIKVVVGKDLIAWSEAAQQLAAISAYNNSLILGSIAAAGGIAAMSSSDASAKNIGTIAAIGGGTALSVNNIRSKLSDLERAKLVPSSHLYSQDFIVPPNLHAKKWVTIYTEDPNAIPYIYKIIIKYTTETGETETATIPFRSYDSSSEWQKENPERKKMKKSNATT